MHFPLEPRHVMPGFHPGSGAWVPISCAHYHAGKDRQGSPKKKKKECRNPINTVTHQNQNTIVQNNTTQSNTINPSSNTTPEENQNTVTSNDTTQTNNTVPPPNNNDNPHPPLTITIPPRPPLRRSARLQKLHDILPHSLLNTPQYKKPTTYFPPI